MAKTQSKPRRPKGYRIIKRALSLLENQAMSIAKRLAAKTPGIVGVDYGFVTKRSLLTGDLGIRFHVIDKQPATTVPEEHQLPKSILGIRCDVIEARYDTHSEVRRARTDPLCPGISVGSVKSGSTGTLGAIVLDRVSKAPGILSNWHVLGGFKGAQRGDEICQPGLQHAVGQPPIIAKLERMTQLEHALDAAFALLKDADMSRFTKTALDLPTFPRAAVEPALGMKVIKSSVTTDVTPGVIDGHVGSYQANYERYGLGIVWLDGFRVVPDPDDFREEISMSGDSGAVWVLKNAPDQAVGLHFAGEPRSEPNAEYALVHPMSSVLEKLDIEFPGA